MNRNGRERAARAAADDISTSLADTTGRGLGEVQVSVLKALLVHGKWPGGWKWDTDSRTAKVLDSLVKRGLVEDLSMRSTSVPTKEFDQLDYRPGKRALDRMAWYADQYADVKHG